MLAILLGALAGYGLDRYFETNPVFFLVFTGFGLVAGMLNVFRASNKLK